MLELFLLFFTLVDYMIMEVSIMLIKASSLLFWGQTWYLLSMLVVFYIFVYFVQIQSLVPVEHNKVLSYWSWRLKVVLLVRLHALEVIFFTSIYCYLIQTYCTYFRPCILLLLEALVLSNTSFEDIVSFCTYLLDSDFSMLVVYLVIVVVGSPSHGVRCHHNHW